MLAEDDWPALVGANDGDGDGLHLSSAGQAFVAEQLLKVLPSLGLERDALPYELPWGSEVDASAPGSTLRAHFARHRAALAAGSGAGGPAAGGAGPVTAPCWLHTLHGPVYSAFLAGTLVGALAVLSLRRRRRR
mmetsp:Transcript_29109/g.87003  ORF Transcript_29109/g.87003 Transcript_29109/m.87003 type:complete len:134 (+) Transcript_29109:410-811(+)